MKKYLFNLRNRYFLFLDAVLFMLIPFLAVAFRFDGFHYSTPNSSIFYFAAVFTLLKVVILYLTGIYGIYWHHASIDDLLKILWAGIQTLLLEFFLFVVLKRFNFDGFGEIPLSIPILDALFAIFVISLTRLTPRLMARSGQRIAHRPGIDSVNALIVGAGAAGVTVLEEFLRHKETSTHFVGFVDDDPGKAGLKIRGFKVLGNRYHIPEIVKTYDVKKIFIAIPSSSGSSVREIISICNQLEEVEVLTLPPLYDIIDGKVEIDKFRKIQLEDLLRREPIKTDLKALEEMVRNKKILVTGAGGSIGSEICRQLLLNAPDCLYVLGHGENSIFELEMELGRKFPDKKIIPIIADVKDMSRLDYIFNTYRFDFVLHAAAHKHVPLMEKHPYEAVRNNVIGTRNLVEMCVKYDVEKFIMISTDKAVNPTSIMGVSKRIAEMVVIDAAKIHNKKFSVVRFGNVLGSRGSVIRVFQNQLANGGPLTITHPDIKRYFMTIPEAVQLVLQAFIIGNGGDVFVLDMGEPVRIMDLANDLIRLSGIKKHDEIEIKITGLRPGEKLFEELFIEGENYKKTKSDKIFIAENASAFIPSEFEQKLEKLLAAVNGDPAPTETVKRLFKEIVPEYKPLPEKDN
ncbi:MAG: nucleoside-diphosphate sugar epimerase/dehydratase [Calditrichia bacterium]